MSGSVTKPRIMFIFCLCPVESMRNFASPNLDGHLVEGGHRAEMLVAFARGALPADPPLLLAREDPGEVTCLDGVRHGGLGPLAPGPGAGVRGTRRPGAAGIG